MKVTIPERLFYIKRGGYDWKEVSMVVFSAATPDGGEQLLKRGPITSPPTPEMCKGTKGEEGWAVGFERLFEIAAARFEDRPRPSLPYPL